MDLPIELWHLIAYNLKFDLDLYKNGSLVNKSLCKVVKNIYDKIPNETHIEWRCFNYIPNEKHELIRSEILKPIEGCESYQYNLINSLLKVYKMNCY